MTDKPIKIRDNPADQYCEVWVNTGQGHQPILGPDGRPSRFGYREFSPRTFPTPDDFEVLGRRVLKAVQTC